MKELLLHYKEVKQCKVDVKPFFDELCVNLEEAFASIDTKGAFTNAAYVLGIGGFTQALTRTLNADETRHSLMISAAKFWADMPGIVMPKALELLVQTNSN